MGKIVMSLDGRTRSRRTWKRTAHNESKRRTEPYGGDPSNTATQHDVGYDAEEEYIIMIAQWSWRDLCYLSPM